MMNRNNMDSYAMLDTRDWRKTRDPKGELSLKSLDNDWHGVIGSILPPSRDALEGDVTDARGVFQRSELRSELKRMNRMEVEGRLGLSMHKVDDILRRAELRTNQLYSHLVHRRGDIHYNAFLEVIQEYRLNSEQETTLRSAVRVFAYVEEFSCTPPTLVMIILTLSELAVYLYTIFSIRDHKESSEKMELKINKVFYIDKNQAVPITWTGPVPYCSPLIYNPKRRHEVWRFISYMFIHIGIGHFVFNMIMQIVVGVSLEMEQTGYIGSLKVLVVYLSGVVAGSLGTSLTDPGTYLAGASGGVYALIAAHLATMLLNFREDSNLRIKKVIKKPITMIIRTSFILLLTIHDVGFAVYVRFYDPENRTGFTGHLCGALAGLTVGLFLLDNRRVRSWEPILQWAALILFMVGLVFSIVWNVMANTWTTDFFPPLGKFMGNK